MTVHPQAKIDPSVQVGASCHIGPSVQIEKDVVLADSVRIEGAVVVGAGSRLSRGVTIGAPQHLAHLDSDHATRIGAGAVLREFVTVHGSTGDTPTTLGKDVFLMALCHVGHDSCLGDGVVLTNLVQLAGHVVVGDRAVIGGGTMVHQFLEIGTCAMVAGMSPIRASVPPFSLVADHGFGTEILGVNRRGLPDAQTRKEAVAAMRIYRDGKNSEEILLALENTDTPPARELRLFLLKWKKSCRWHR